MSNLSEKSSTEASSIVMQSIMTPKLWGVVVIGAALSSFISAFMANFVPEYLAGIPTQNVSYMLFFLLFLFAEIIPRIKAVDARFYTILWCALTVAAVPAASDQMVGTLLDHMYYMRNAESWLLLWSKFKDEMSWLWGPPAEVQRLQFYGGAAVPWSEWTLPMMAWMGIATLWWFYTKSMINILRYQWLDVEKLPYPGVYPVITLIQSLTEPERKIERKLLLIGGLIGFLFYLPVPLAILFAWFPDIYGLGKSPWVHWGFVINTNLTPLKDTFVGLNTLSLSIFEMCLAYLMPIDILQSAILSNIIFILILPQIAYAMGYYPGAYTMTDVYKKRIFMWTSPPLYRAAMIEYGMMPAIVIFWFIFNWRYFARTFRKVDPQRDAAEPMPYRRSYIIFFASMILLIIVYILVGGMTISSAVTVILHQLVFFILSSRLAGLATFEYQGWRLEFTAGWLNMIHGYNLTQENVTLDVANDFIMLSQAQWVSSPDIMGNYRVGATTKTSYRDIWHVATVAFLISAVIAWPTYLWIRHTYGAALPRPIDHRGWILYEADIRQSQTRPSPDYPTWLWSAGAGALIIFASYLVRMRWYWFPLDPIGIFLGVASAVPSSSYLLAWIIGWISKKLTLKIGGTSLFLEKGVALATGLMLGWTLCGILASLTSVYRFFYPY